MLKNTKDENHKYNNFYETMNENFRQNIDEIISFVDKKCKNVFERESVYKFSTMYKMSGHINYNKIKLILLNEIKN